MFLNAIVYIYMYNILTHIYVFIEYIKAYGTWVQTQIILHVKLLYPIFLSYHLVFHYILFILEGLVIPFSLPNPQKYQYLEDT